VRDVVESNTYKKDYQREVRGKHQATLKKGLPHVIDMLASDATLPVRLRDHVLAGNWQGNNECHVRPDLLLVYHKNDENELYLVRLGSHAELFCR
jgi:mRNA interferase YafQ